jgi:adenylylsulfate kinase
MPTVKLANDEAFAVWLTGLPASGKSTIAKALAQRLQTLRVAVLESDVLRPVLMPEARYDEQTRDHFYRQVAFIATLLVQHGVPVIIDATANLRSYRQAARDRIPRFVEVFVDTPLEVCQARDPKGIYRSAREGESSHVPGIQVPYEAPERPELWVQGDRELANDAVERIVAALIEKNFLVD